MKRVNLARKLFIHAVNVHSGGGYTLLRALLKSLPVDLCTVAILDTRMTISDTISDNVRIKWIVPSIWQRLKAEWWLARHVKKDDIVLCFGNLPSLFTHRGRAVVFIQNRYLIENVELCAFPLKIRARINIERLWLSTRMSSVDEFVVQTPSMKRLLESKTRGKIPVHVHPFIDKPKDYTRSSQPAISIKNVNYNFLYVASGESHKNHLTMIEAWCLLADEGLFPSLRLTLDKTRYSSLCREIEKMRQRHGLKLINIGPLSYCEVLALYKHVDALIYPSTFESFGLPLIEARQAELPVLASELDYVRDLFDPEQTFDPDSAISIARAVKRFLGWVEPPLPLQDPAEFVKHILKRSE
jgi:glycosyltransferase involved in cell wall biosynthesis